MRLSRWRAYRQPKELVSESLRQHHSPTRTGDSGFPVHTEQGSPTFSPTAPRRYGLPAEDRSSSGSESEEDSPARTGRQQTSAAQAHIEQLTSTLEFKRYMLERGLTLEEVKASERKLQLFQDLRQCDPMAFRNLCTSDLAEYDVQRALPVWLALEYVFDIAPLVCAAVLLALFGLQQGIWTKAVLLIAVANMLAWATSSSLFGRPLDLWRRAAG
ncbi:hypothetical protein WJX72_011541 [[Myrmecia] bisecta]|uniref:Uncharacterized protein n=1 Tax=[Myrmecia] bisecta TaxID=41462 RepID=A0AAW1QST9_9CHLO